MAIFSFDRDMIIFIALVLAVVFLNVFPIPALLKLSLFVIIVILQALFVYHGLKRHRR